MEDCNKKNVSCSLPTAFPKFQVPLCEHMQCETIKFHRLEQNGMSGAMWKVNGLHKQIDGKKPIMIDAMRMNDPPSKIKISLDSGQNNWPTKTCLTSQRILDYIVEDFSPTMKMAYIFSRTRALVFQLTGYPLCTWTSRANKPGFSARECTRSCKYRIIANSLYVSKNQRQNIMKKIYWSDLGLILSQTEILSTSLDPSIIRVVKNRIFTSHHDFSYPMTYFNNSFLICNSKIPIFINKSIIGTRNN